MRAKELELFRRANKSRRVRNAVKANFSNLIDLFVPPLCPLTNERIPAPGFLSPSAWGAIQFIDDPACDRCGAPFSHDVGKGAICARCAAEPPDFDRARAAVAYDEASHGLIVSFKYADRTELTRVFACWLERAGAPLFDTGAVLAPTPLHRSRLVSRRFNQAALLASALARKSGLACAPLLLERTRATPPQTSLSSEGRRRNVAGAFAVREEMKAVADKAHIILVDDVLTTGATLSACARALKRAGARRVDALVLARVVKDGVALA